MEKRRFGQTGHLSTLAIFGAAVFYKTNEDTVNQVMERVVQSGINHIDVAPGYGMAEEVLGPWMEKHRGRFFLGCKTEKRGKGEAAAELRHSLELLHSDRFDLFQLHAVTNMEELDQVTGTGGALEAIIDARDEGLTRYIGITGHGLEAPAVFLEALERFDFDTVLFPINFILYADPVYRQSAEELLAICRQRDVGVMTMKAMAKGPWGNKPKTHTSWYEPFTDPSLIQKAINFALSQGVTGSCTVSDPELLPLFLKACENFHPMAQADQEEMVAGAMAYEAIFDAAGPR